VPHRRLADTELEVSEVCLGTITSGEQNSEAEALAQLALPRVRSRWFVAVQTIGATSLPQLAEDLDAAQRDRPDAEALDDVDAVLLRDTNAAFCAGPPNR
jgi:aryl-alcohol dehydrogenase-like predicted oxidoreductase